MINNQLTREENVQAVFDLKAGYTLGLADVEILKRVARMALAAIDSKPVQMFGIGSIFKPQRVIEQEADCDDCAHYNPKICHGEGCPAISQQSAQPVPVVPKEWTIADAVKFCRETGRQDAGAAMDAFNACRAAMLNGGK